MRKWRNGGCEWVARRRAGETGSALPLLLLVSAWRPERAHGTAETLFLRSSPLLLSLRLSLSLSKKKKQNLSPYRANH